jgi:hypothetical protein
LAKKKVKNITEKPLAYLRPAAFLVKRTVPDVVEPVIQSKF